MSTHCIILSPVLGAQSQTYHAISQSPRKSFHSTREVNSLLNSPELVRESVCCWLQESYSNTGQGLVKRQKFFWYFNTKKPKISDVHYAVWVLLQQQQQGLNSLDKSVSHNVLCILSLWPQAGSTELHSSGWHLAGLCCGLFACLLANGVSCGTVLMQDWWPQRSMLGVTQA